MSRLRSHSDLTEGLNGVSRFPTGGLARGLRADFAVDLQDERHKNRQGGLHGGVTASLIDAATGFCGVYRARPRKAPGERHGVPDHVNFVGRAKGTTN